MNSIKEAHPVNLVKEMLFRSPTWPEDLTIRMYLAESFYRTTGRLRTGKLFSSLLLLAT